MILSGDAIDGTLGVAFGITTMAAAALGNAVSNVAGMFLHGIVEQCASVLGLPDPELTLYQLKHGRTGAARTAGSIVLRGQTGGTFVV